MSLRGVIVVSPVLITSDYQRLLVNQFNGYLLTCTANSTSAHYKASTKTQVKHKTVQIHKNKTLNKQKTKNVRSKQYKRCAVKLGYNDLGLCDTSFITLYIQWYQLIPHKTRIFLPRLVRHV
jgi:hypothetical protein